MYFDSKKVYEGEEMLREDLRYFPSSKLNFLPYL